MTTPVRERGRPTPSALSFSERLEEAERRLGELHRLVTELRAALDSRESPHQPADEPAWKVRAREAREARARFLAELRSARAESLSGVSAMTPSQPEPAPEAQHDDATEASDTIEVFPAPPASWIDSSPCSTESVSVTILHGPDPRAHHHDAPEPRDAPGLASPASTRAPGFTTHGRLDAGCAPIPPEPARFRPVSPADGGEAPPDPAAPGAVRSFRRVDR
ncbi:MAG: hypothetical protein ACTS22_00235 [Phycisphaerales bacterium]